MRAIVFLCLALVLPACSTFSPRAAEVPAGCYQNPVVERDTPDPFVLVHDGVFYCYATESGPPGFQVLESPDLVHWTHRGVALVDPTASGHYWAPEVVERDGRFWMYYSIRNHASKQHDLCVAVADHPVGPFTRVGVLIPGAPTPVKGEPEPCIGAIDSTVFRDDDGQTYLAYSQEAPRAIVMRPLDPSMTSLGTERVVLIRADRDEEQGVVEAPTLLKRDGVYHLLYSAGPFQGRAGKHWYSVRHASAPSIRGPWTKSDRPVMQTIRYEIYGPGHQCVVTLPAVGDEPAQDWLVYHAWDGDGAPMYGRNRIGRSLRIDRLRWVDGLPVTDGPTRNIQPAPVIR
ncbi:MAG: glycoside hydrolase family 43 protein [Phycisphaerales bacterium]|nr:glycoside hydrolase family 43 protein [Phycisphaerales bacterium]